MTALLDPQTADKLTKLCGMFGSAHIGERASAAAMADKIVRGRGLTWGEVIAAVPEPSADDDLIASVLEHSARILTAWELNFLRDIRGRELTEKQRAKLNDIAAKVRGYWK